MHGRRAKRHGGGEDGGGRARREEIVSCRGRLSQSPGDFGEFWLEFRGENGVLYGKWRGWK